MSGETAVVATYPYRHQAELARGYLEDAGLEAALFIDDAGGSVEGMAFTRPARLIVRRADIERAREVLDRVEMS